MKHFILTTIVAFLISTGIFAQSNLIVYSNDGVNFILEVNGVQQNSDHSTNVKVENIAQEFISCRLLFEDKAIPALKKSFPLTKGNEVTAQLVLNKKGQYKLRYMGETPITDATAPSNQTVIRYGEEPVSESIVTPAAVATPNTESTTSTTVTTTTINNGTPANSETIDMNVNINGQTVGISSSISGMETSTTSTVTETTTVTTSSNSSTSTPITSTEGTNVLETVSNGACDSPMPTAELNSALRSMDSKSFEDSKMTLAKQFTKANCLSADQVKTVMQKFTFEESRLNYAKFAYDYCLDQPSYYKVNDAFEFELSIDDLNEFLESK